MQKTVEAEQQQQAIPQQRLKSVVTVPPTPEINDRRDAAQYAQELLQEKRRVIEEQWQRQQQQQQYACKRPYCEKGDSGSWYGSLRLDLKRPRKDKEAENCRTLFVGDLPIGFTSEELYRVFAKDNAYYVEEAKVKGSQCYGFVTFQSTEEAEKVLDDLAKSRCTIQAEGQNLRINWATGKMPAWKKGPAQYRPRELTELESYENPEKKYIGQQKLEKSQFNSPQNGARQMINYGDI
eukprot:TRINITY_DN3812_c0_g1_i1.p3 TRINITY_DN3812_c0_g1~~TRINITY_DN3812_c0_g1_i1.p3  ORF type:complete len:278 (-),score=36.45 TRINITY_DN3812_c0_g1_i1:556-1266(-)